MAARSPSNDSITSPTTDSATNGLKGSSTNGGGESRKSSLKSPDPTPYVTKARVTRPIPPPPSYNPMQFVQIKPCNLYQTAQEQLKKAEEVKKIKEIKKEEPEDWQNNLDNWKSSRRKRVEHIIDRVVEVKKLELEEHDRTRRKSKTFSEMIEERGERGRPRTKLTSLAVYNEDESNDLSDLGIGTSSASGKSSLSEDYDNNSVTSENAELDKAIQDENNLHYKSSLQTREYMASPGYETSSSTAPASSPDPSDLYEGAAIEDYKNRVSRQFRNGSSNMPGAAAAAINNNNHQQNNMHYNNGNNNRNMNGNSNDHQKMPPNTLNIQATSNKDVPMDVYSPRRGNKIEDRLLSFEVTSPSDNQDSVEKTKVDVPKIDISKRKEIFENQRKNSDEKLQLQNGSSVEPPPKVTLRDRFKVAESNSTASNEVPSKKDNKRISTGDASMIRERVQSLEQKQPPSSASSSSEVVITSTRSVDIPPVPPLKDRLSSLQNAAKKEEIKKPPVALVDARQLEIMKKEEETAKQRMQQYSAANSEKSPSPPVITETTTITSEMTMLDNNGDDVDAGADADAFDDSGIQTTDEIIVENCGEHTRSVQQLQEEQLNAAIAALAMEEKQLEEAANAVNQIEAEFEELASTSNVATTNVTSIATTTTNNSTNNSTNNQQSSQQLPYDMDFSINEALELALAAIDKETKLTANDAVIKCMESSTKEIKSKKIKKIEMETINQTTTNKTIRINQKNIEDHQTSLSSTSTSSSSSSVMVEEKKQQQQLHQNTEEQSATYVPPQEHEKAQKNELEPIYENVSSSASPLSSSSSSTSSPTITTTVKATATKSKAKVDSEIIPNGGINYLDNNKHHQHQYNHHSHHHHNHHHHNNQHNHQQHQHYTQQPQQQQQQQPQQHQNNKINSSNNQTNQSNYDSSNNNNSNNIITPTTTITLTIEPNKEEEEPTSNNQTPMTEQEPYYQVPKSSEPYYDAPKHLRPVPLYENIEIFYNGVDTLPLSGNGGFILEPPKEKPPPPPAESPPPIMDEGGESTTDTWSSSDNTYETISSRHSSHIAPVTMMKNNVDHPSPPIKRVNSTKRIKKELRNKRSSFLGIDASALDDEEHYLEMTVAPPPDMAQFLQQERQLEKQLYMKTAGLCDSSDTGESRDSGVSENHSRQSSEHYTNSSEENERHLDVGIDVEVETSTLYPHHHHHHHGPRHHDDTAAQLHQQTPLLQTVKGDSAESWTESATAAAAASQSLTEATATANAKMLSIEEKIREQEEVLRVERELLQLEQEELKRQRENLMFRENMARRELQHGAKMLMSANRHSLQELNGNAALSTVPLTVMPGGMQPQQPQQQIYANVPNVQQQYYQMDMDYRRSMSDLNEYAKKRAGSMVLPPPPIPPTKPMRAMHLPGVAGRMPAAAAAAAVHHQDDYVVMANQRFGGSLVKIAAPPPPLPTAAPRSHIYSNFQHRSQQNLSSGSTGVGSGGGQQPYHGNMTRNTLHALSATPKPKYTDGWVQQQQQQHQQQQQQQLHQNRKSFDASTHHLANDPAWLSAYQQKRKSMPDGGGGNTSSFSAYNGNHWLVQEAEQRRITEEQRRSLSNGSTPLHQKSNGKPLPDAIIQTLTERVQSKGIGERKRLENLKSADRSPLHAAAAYQQNHYQLQETSSSSSSSSAYTQPSLATTTAAATANGPTCTATSTTTSSSSPSSSGHAAQDKVLSISGKKKCSHCGDELGRGAAMIIESLLLFYHINCFKCCVCHVQLGDGLNGTDVRVRNHKLHCQNCYSSDDGIKFSCV